MGVGVVLLDQDSSVGSGGVFGVAPLCLFLNLISLCEDGGGEAWTGSHALVLMLARSGLLQGDRGRHR